MLNFRGLSISLFYQLNHQLRIADVILPVLDFLCPRFRFLGFYFRLLCPAGIKDGSNDAKQGGQGGNDLYHIHNFIFRLFSAVEGSDIFASDSQSHGTLLETDNVPAFLRILVPGKYLRIPACQANLRFAIHQGGLGVRRSRGGTESLLLARSGIEVRQTGEGEQFGIEYLSGSQDFLVQFHVFRMQIRQMKGV